jgi:hypothetical protein
MSFASSTSGFLDRSLIGIFVHALLPDHEIGSRATRRFTALLALAPLGRCHLDDETVSRDAVRLRPGDTVRLNLQLAVR